MTPMLNQLNEFNTGSLGCKEFSASGKSSIQWGDIPGSDFEVLALYGCRVDSVRDVATFQAPCLEHLANSFTEGCELFAAWLSISKK